MRDERALKDIKEALQVIYDSEGEGYISLESKEAPVSLEKEKRRLLEEHGEVWRHKIRVIWLQRKDENTNFFQAYAKGRRS